MRSRKSIFAILGIFAAVLSYWSWSRDKNGFEVYRNVSKAHIKESGSARAAKAKNEAPSEKKVWKNAAKKGKRAPAQSSKREEFAFKEAPAQPKDYKKKYKQARHQSVSGDFKDESGNQYLLLRDYHAIRRTHENQNDFPQAILKNGYFLIREPPDPGDRARVLKNISTGGLVVFTGVLKTRLKDMSFADELASDFQCQVANRYDHISAVFYRFDSYEQTLAAHQAFQEHPLVISSEIELLEGERGPR